MSTTATLWISVGVGLSLFTVTLFMGWISTNYGVNSNILKWFALPVLGYIVTFGMNAFLQSVTCGSVNFPQIALGSIFVPGAILLVNILTLLWIIRSPIEAAVPGVYRDKYGGLFAVAYYMFWAGMFGESMGSGFSLSCPKP